MRNRANENETVYKLSNEELREMLGLLDGCERDVAARIVTECLKRIFDELFIKNKENEK